jgi:hypothetical protein
VPIFSRALKDRGGDLKRKSAVILGNMASMIADPKILSPYLPQVVQGLKGYYSTLFLMFVLPPRKP